MQLSKPKITADFIKTFESPIYDAKIDLSEVDLKTFIIEEKREDIKVVYEGFKDLVSSVDFNIIDGVVHIKVNSREKSGISNATKLHSVFTTENKLNIYLPLHFKNYLIDGNIANIRVNNLQAENVSINIATGSVKVKYCEIENDVTIKCENAHTSLKSLNANNLTINNVNGVTKVRNSNITNNIVLNTENGLVQAKDIESQGTINAITSAGSIDFDDVYANKVDINAKTGIVNYFNGNFNREIETNISVEQGMVRTNVNRENIH